jgi:hypothetical protein
MPWLFGLLRAILMSPRTQFYLILFLISKLKKYMSPEDGMTPAQLPQTPKEPLALPRGSVRAILTILLTVAFLASYFFPDLVHFPPQLMDMWLFVLGYYLGFRSDNNPLPEIKS